MRLISQKGWGYVDVEYENGTITMHYKSEGTRIIYSCETIQKNPQLWLNIVLWKRQKRYWKI